MRRFRAGLHQDTGASTVEYGLIVFAVAALIVLAVVSFGGAVHGLFQNSCDSIKHATETSAPTTTCS